MAIELRSCSLLVFFPNAELVYWLQTLFIQLSMCFKFLQSPACTVSLLGSFDENLVSRHWVQQCVNSYWFCGFWPRWCVSFAMPYGPCVYSLHIVPQFKFCSYGCCHSSACYSIWFCLQQILCSASWSYAFSHTLLWYHLSTPGSYPRCYHLNKDVLLSNDIRAQVCFVSGWFSLLPPPRPPVSSVVELLLTSGDFKDMDDVVLHFVRLHMVCPSLR